MNKMWIIWLGMDWTIFQLIEPNRYIVRIRPNIKEHLGYDRTMSWYNLVKSLTSGFGLVTSKLFSLQNPRECKTATSSSSITTTEEQQVRNKYNRKTRLNQFQKHKAEYDTWKTGSYFLRFLWSKVWTGSS